MSQIMEAGDLERWRDCTTLYSRAEVAVEGGEDLLLCRALFSTDQKWLFVACGCHVKVVSLSSREVVHTLDHHTKAVTTIAINPRNLMQLVSASLDGHLVLWDYTDGALLKVVDFSTPIFKFKFRPGGEEPSVFVSLQRGEADYVVVGLSSHVITERDASVAPRDQLADAPSFFSTKKPNNFTFTHDGSHVVTFSGKKLLVYDLENESSYSYPSSHPLSTMDCHPHKMCIATGNSLGEIQLWYDFARSDTKVVVTTFHWHAHGVADVCFTSDGSYLLSGGEESVLVLWQLDSHKKQFRPRLGAPISKLACCHGDSYFAVSLQSNVVCLLSGLDTEVEHIVGGLRKAYVQNPSQSGLRTGLVWCPRSNSILLNSTPGQLQFYDPFTDLVTREMDIAYLNVVSRPDNKPLELTAVEHAAFSPDGQWLATIEARDDRQTAPELKMKLWEFSTTHQRYVLNTCVDPPHDDKVTGLLFQPSRSHTHCSRRAHQSKNQLVHMAITTSVDGRFKSWVLVDERREEEVEGEKVQPSWSCRSVGYYHNLPCLGAAFSEDGSLLALNFKKFVTVWDPFSCDLLKTLSAPFIYEQFACITFGNHSSSQYLLASTSAHLLVWNMLTCTIQWCIKTSVNQLIADPFSSIAVAFVASGAKTTDMYVFRPSSPTPLAVHKSVCQGEVTGSVFMPTNHTNRTSSNQHTKNSILYFMDKKQILYSLKERDEVDTSDKQNSLSTNHIENGLERRHFTEIFGDTKQGTTDGKSSPRRPDAPHEAPKHGRLLSAAPHVLPPVSLLCQHYLRGLLPSLPSRSSLSETDVQEPDHCSESGDASSSEDEELQGGQVVPQKRQLDDNSHNPVNTRNVDYSWLIDCFKAH